MILVFRERCSCILALKENDDSADILRIYIYTYICPGDYHDSLKIYFCCGIMNTNTRCLMDCSFLWKRKNDCRHNTFISSQLTKGFPTEIKRYQLNTVLPCKFNIEKKIKNWVQVHYSLECQGRVENELLPQLSQWHVLLRFLLHYLCNSHFKIFLCHMNSSLPQGKHPSFCAHSLHTWKWQPHQK